MVTPMVGLQIRGLGRGAEACHVLAHELRKRRTGEKSRFAARLDDLLADGGHRDYGSESAGDLGHHRGRRSPRHQQSCPAHAAITGEPSFLDRWHLRQLGCASLATHAKSLEAPCADLPVRPRQRRHIVLCLLARTATTAAPPPL